MRQWPGVEVASERGIPAPMFSDLRRSSRTSRKPAENQNNARLMLLCSCLLCLGPAQICNGAAKPAHWFLPFSSRAPLVIVDSSLDVFALSSLAIIPLDDKHDCASLDSYATLTSCLQGPTLYSSPYCSLEKTADTLQAPTPYLGQHSSAIITFVA